MASFKILNTEGEQVSFKELDSLVAKFWNKEVDEKAFANPYAIVEQKEDSPRAYQDAVRENYENRQKSWVKVIDARTVELSSFCFTWNNIAEAIIRDYVANAFILEGDKIELASLKANGDTITCDVRVASYLEYILDKNRPFIELINYFKQQGYKPVKL